MKASAIAVTLSALVLSPIVGCSKSLTRVEALRKFEETQAFTMLSHGVQPDGSIVKQGSQF